MHRGLQLITTDTYNEEKVDLASRHQQTWAKEQSLMVFGDLPMHVRVCFCQHGRVCPYPKLDVRASA